ncbi:MAG: autotransporter-associated beta strand repeat-containing protein [Terrimicrobiaceae bacterium]
MKTNTLSFPSAFVAALLAAIAALSSANAADQTYDDTNVNNVWDLTTANWVSPTVWANGNSAIFGGTGESVNVDAAISAASITFNVGGYTIADGDNNGSLTLTGATVVTGSNTSGTNTIGENITLSGGGTKNFLQNGTGTLALTGIISESTAGTAVTYARSGTAGALFTVTGLNTYTGTTSLNDGTLTVSSIGSTTAAGALGQGTTLNFGSATSSRTAALVYTGNGETTDKVINLGTGSGGRSIDTTGATGGLVFTSDTTINGTGAAVLTLLGNTTGNAINGKIVDPTGSTTGVTKGGDGTWALGGANTYTGTTTVSAGTLLINGNASSATGAVAVNVGTLGGNGTIGGDVTIANVTTAILAPGTAADATETLALNTKNLTFSGSNSQLKLDITGTAAGSFDRVVGINTLAQFGAITFNLTGTYGTASWDVLDFTGLLASSHFSTIALTGTYAGNLTRGIGPSNTWTGNVGGQAWTYEETTGVLGVVPEPSTWALLAFSLTTVMVLRRRRRTL